MKSGAKVVLSRLAIGDLATQVLDFDISIANNDLAIPRKLSNVLISGIDFSLNRVYGFYLSIV